MFAKNEETLNVLLNSFKVHEIEKHYVCIVIGKMPKSNDVLNDYLFKDSKKSMVYISDTHKKGYLPITTSYNVLKYDKEKNLSLLDIELQTGRTHQIRAHLAYIGHPILGDGKYGKNEINKSYRQKVQLLCAYSLKFKFNNNNNNIEYLNGKEFRINYPKFFNQLIK